ncbi:efflux transporter outer membrane subunit [Chitinophaga oryziterrae]|uniref:Efflux transporter outer membrane subunit n=1 Tax=Chitinophaga oryziterrae TaxID=1031224 RepID=A0A6N8J4E6_9BACT|nr:efflux transporter outer membrane subunit [Chitinophaga oryziterrae]MVT39571.1 efflux transporter outer membrane subunit [Chitinophaga oryziterrae]
MKQQYIVLLIFIISFAACRTGKNYVRPELSMPAQYRGDTVLVNDTSTIPGYKTFFNNKKLVALIDSALFQNRDMQIAAKNIESARLVFKRIKLNYMPELTAQVTGSYTRSSNNSLAGIGNSQFAGSYGIPDYTASMGLTWEIDLWGRIRREKEESLANLVQTEEIKKGIQTRLIADIANGYYNLLMLDEQLKVALKSILLSDSTVQITTVLFRVGEANNLALQQAKAQLEVARQLLPDLERSIALQENALSLLCGHYAHKIERTADDGNDFNKEIKKAYPVAVLASRPDIMAAEQVLRAANARVGITQTAMYPALTINGTGGLNSFKSSNWFAIPGSLFGNIAEGLAQPVFQRRKLRIQYEQAKIDREKAVIEFRQTVLQGYADVSDALISNQQLAMQYQAARNRNQSLEQAVNSANTLFKTGMANYLEIIVAQNNYLQSSLNESQLSREIAGGKIELYRALGGGK